MKQRKTKESSQDRLSLDLKQWTSQVECSRKVLLCVKEAVEK